MRRLGLSLCLVACTIENPAFFATPTEGTATATSTTSAASDSGGPGGTAPTTSTVTSTSGPDLTSTSSSGLATTMNLSDTVATTDPPGTTSTTDPSMTATSEPGSSSSSSSGGPMMCAAFDDPLGPFLQLLALPGYLPVTTASCEESQQKVIGGRLYADANGFTITKDLLCQPDILLVPGLHFPVPLPPEIPAKGKCVQLTFSAHTDYENCTISAFQVTLENQPVLLGSFGLTELPNAAVEVALAPKGVCACPECCGADAPDPDLYKMLAAGVAVPEGGSQEIAVNAFPFVFTNLRSHVHAPECNDKDLKRPDWLHLDWVAARLP